MDKHTFSNYQVVCTKHLHLNLQTDFNRKKIIAKAVHTLNVKFAGTFILDTHSLIIKKVTFGKKSKKAEFQLSEQNEILGQALTIFLPEPSNEVCVEYETSENSQALQWLSTQQTKGKKYPFLFTQSQAILARSWIPCQDTPSVRFTYSAKVVTSPELLALMSASNPKKLSKNGIYYFEQNCPIPSYLLALAVGRISFAGISARTGVYAEPELLEQSHSEFSKMEEMLEAAEDLYGKYAWKRFDVLVLPPSFPFGGMENPCLTFATPTIIAGDKSLTNLIAHELAHSWSGNLVTNATWDDFWLNEGFTVYFERRIMEKIEGESYAQMLVFLGFTELQETVSNFGYLHPDTCLKLKLENRNPDDGVTAIAYEKGFLFLQHIENCIGRTQFDQFIYEYFYENKFACMDTDKFVEILRKKIINNQPDLEKKININKWIFEPGIPDFAKIVESEKFCNVEKIAKNWLQTKEIELDICKNWSSHEWLFFLKELESIIDKKQQAELDTIFNFTQNKNCEIKCQWLKISISNNYEEAWPALESFLTEVGRRKFQIPLYSALLEKNDGRKKALEIYQKAKNNYHSISIATLDKLFNL